MRSWRVYAVCATLILAFIYLLPTIKPGIWPYKKINLGLDLQGGIHLVLDVEVEKAIDNMLEHRIYELRDQMKKSRIPYTAVRKLTDGGIAIVLSKTEDSKAFTDFHKKEFPDMEIKRGSAGKETEFRLYLASEEKERTRKMATAQALETIRNRIDQFGVNEPEIRIQGGTRIQIQLPGIDNPERAKALIGKTALLEFKIVEDGYNIQDIVKTGQSPPGTEVLYEVQRNDAGQEINRVPYLVRKRAVLAGSSLTDARVQFDSQFNEPYVAISFDKQGSRQFERITGENIHKRMAIVLDNNVYSAPVIQDKISGGNARISGSFNMESATDLAIILRAGTLAAPVTIIEERSVGPTLGSDSIRKGIISMLVGGGFVLLFMAVYYKLSGVITDITLILNIVLIVAALAAFGATLTLPGLAGMVLTMGMAVDANTLIFERIREELRNGRSPMAAIDAGFERASLTILDANITTLIAALVLFQFGTGPIKGFAVTLSLGVLASMFTALIVMRLVFDLIYRRKTTISKLSI